MATKYWLVKQEPEDYSWDDFVVDGKSAWTGVRNFQARNNLRAMQLGEPVLYYHSGAERQVVGIARVLRTAYPDPTATDGDWSGVDLKPAKRLAKPVTLQTIKATEGLRNILLVRQSRLSVLPLTKDEMEQILQLGETRFLENEA
jgi:predicted RNA-binding protein with PUA-like domain